MQADRKAGHEIYRVPYSDLMPLSVAFFDALVMEIALIVSLVTLPVTATSSLRNGRIWFASPVTE